MTDDMITVSFCHDGVLDRIRDVEAIVLGLFEDERPLKGMTGFVDWRLHGLLSRLVLQQRLEGTLLEGCLMPSRGRLPMDMVFLFGLGSLEELSVQTFQRVAFQVVGTMARARVGHFALSLWDLTRGRVAPEEAARIVLRAFLSDRRHRPRGGRTAVTFVETGPWGHALRDAFLKLAERKDELPVRLELH